MGRLDWSFQKKNTFCKKYFMIYILNYEIRIQVKKEFVFGRYGSEYLIFHASLHSDNIRNNNI